MSSQTEYQKEYWSSPENRERKRINAQRLYREHKEFLKKRMRENALRLYYGLTVASYNNMLRKQHGGCAICGRLPGKKQLAVDHDHKTGKVRALLCSQCNQLLGLAAEDPMILRLAALYIEEHNIE